MNDRSKLAVIRPAPLIHPRVGARVFELVGIDALRGLRPEWQSLLATVSHASIFSTWEWLSAWWNAFGGSFNLTTLAIFDSSDHLVGLASLCTRKARLPGALSVKPVCLLGDGSGDSSNLDILAAPGWEPFVITGLLDYLEDRRERWSIAQFNSFSNESPTPAYLVSELQRRKWRCECRERPGMVLDFLEGWEGYLRQLSSRERRRVRVYIRRVEQAKDFEVRRCGEGSELRARLANFVDLHQRRWQSRGQRGSFHCGERRQFYEELSCLLASQGSLELWLLEHDGRPVAGEFDIRYRDTVYALQAGFDPAYAAQHPGYMLRACVLQRMINAGVRRYDFLSGYDAYKQRWAGRMKTYQDIHFAIPGTRGSTYLRLAANTEAAKTWLRPHVPPRLWAAARRLARELRSGTE